MKKNVKAIFIILLIILLLIGIVSVCFQLNYLYHKNWIIGKTSAEIQEQYGEFDQARMLPSSDGLYKRCVCSYYLTEYRVGGSVVMFSISFDENGFARKCGVEEGPTGG